MRTHLRPLALVVTCLATLAWPAMSDEPLAAAASTARPEEVGLSSERLKRIGELLQRQIDAKVFPGAVRSSRATAASRTSRPTA